MLSFRHFVCFAEKKFKTARYRLNNYRNFVMCMIIAIVIFCEVNDQATFDRISCAAACMPRVCADPQILSPRPSADSDLRSAPAAV